MEDVKKMGSEFLQKQTGRKGANGPSQFIELKEHPLLKDSDSEFERL